MRITKLLFIAAAAATHLAACTVKDIDTPPLAGPSSLARTIIMTADRDTLVQDGVQEAAIRLTAVVQPGQSENVRLRAQIEVDGVPQDFGTLSNKNPITPTTIFYRAPAAPLTAAGQTSTRITIAVTPDDSGDFRAEVARQLDIQLIPPGVILPTNPNLVADFTFTPTTPRVLDTVTFDAGPTTNGGVACANACLYNWNFGDGTSGTGRTTTHQYRRPGSYPVILSVTDNRGSTTQAVKSIVVQEGTPPTTGAITVSPTPASPGQPVFFSAEAARPAAGRTIVSYDWNFGDGSTGSGVTTNHTYFGPGNYTITLTVTDDAGSRATISTTLQVTTTGGTTASFTVTPSSPRVGQSTVFDASASTPGAGAQIVSYSFNWGDGSPPETSTNPIQSHVYQGAGTVVASVTVTDSLGRSSTRTQSVTIQP